MQYHVRALSADSLMVTLTLDAQDEAEARRQVQSRGLHVAQIHSQASTPWAMRKTSGSSASPLSVVLFSQELLALLRAGLSIVECLEALLEKEANAATRSVLTRLLTSLRDGKRFSAALTEQPELFTPLYIGIVQAAEGTSDLPRALERFIGYRQRIEAVRSKIISAAIYPLILLTVGGLVCIFLIAYVVPRFSVVYQGTGRSLPWMSELLLGWGQYASQHGAGLAMGMAAVLVGATFFVRRNLARDGLARLLAKMPGVGERARIYALSRLYLTLGMLLEGGIPIVPAMRTVLATVSPDMRDRLGNAIDAVLSGSPLSAAFEMHGLTTPISLRLLRVGERSGDMGRMLTQSAEFYDGEVGRWIDRFTRMLEPLLMAAIGLVVGTIVVLLYMPIFDLAGSFQ